MYAERHLALFGLRESSALEPGAEQPRPPAFEGRVCPSRGQPFPRGFGYRSPRFPLVSVELVVDLHIEKCPILVERRTVAAAQVYVVTQADEEFAEAVLVH